MSLVIFKIFFFLLTFILWILTFHFKQKKIFFHSNNEIQFDKNNIYKFVNEKKFIDKCLKLILFNHNFNYTNKNIKVSTIIPVYNSEKTIMSSIRSIQNQNFSGLEIILINDYSKDNSLGLIKQLQNEDPRIRIINNKKNMGTLYSRCIGVLTAKGEFIFSLDNDDMFFNEYIFDNVYRIAKFRNFDIVKFQKYYILKDDFNINKIKNRYLVQKNNLILRQPELGIYPITKKKIFKHNDYIIWDKCIKKNIYLKAIFKLGNDIYNRKISWNEDIIIIFLIFNIAQSFISINKYGVIHIISKSSASFTQSPNDKIYCDIFFLDILFNYSKEKNKNYAVDYLIKNKRFNYKYKKEKIKMYLKTIINKIISSKYITTNNKIIINNKLSLLLKR